MQRTGLTDDHRAKAMARNASCQRQHDARSLPYIRDLRARGHSWRSIAAYLDSCVEPPGRRGGWSPGAWSHKAVQRIARRHGIV